MTIEDIVSKTPDLPSIPAAAIRVVRECQSTSASASKVAEILSTDQALASRVLRLANSAFYGLSGKVTSLQDAVIVLGFRSVKDLSMVASTYPWLSRPITGYCLGPKQLWTHSFSTAVASKLVAELSNRCPQDVAFTAGLLHDIGKVALGLWMENKIGGILLYANREGLTFDQAEKRILGYDHCQVGQYMAKNWNLPDEIVLAARFHHNPDELRDRPNVVDCVHVGNYLTLAMGFGLGGDGLTYNFSEQSLFRLGLQESRLDEITDRFASQVRSYEKLFEEYAA